MALARHKPRSLPVHKPVEHAHVRFLQDITYGVTRWQVAASSPATFSPRQWRRHLIAFVHRINRILAVPGRRPFVSDPLVRADESPQRDELAL